MDLGDLRTFVEIADTGGVAPGARRLGLPKSIVSRHLARLEDALGAQLLSRTTRGSTLTEAGATFREHALRILAEVDAAQETLAPEGALRGVLRIAAPLSFGTSRLAPVLAALAERHPLLQMETSYSDRFVDLVAEGFDCAIRLGQLKDSSLIARRICSFPVGLVASPAYLDKLGIPKTLEDLEQHHAATKKGEIWPLLEGGKVVAVRPRTRFFADNGEALLAAALAGIGIVGLPKFMTDPHVSAGRLVAVLPDHPPREPGIYVVRPPAAFPSRKVRMLIDTLVEHFGSEGPLALTKGCNFEA